MELAEPIDSINKQLTDSFGMDTITGQPIFRVIWAADQYEKRLTKFTLEGIELLYPEVRLLPKYPQNDIDWKDRWILERLVIVPIANEKELPLQKVSYEPLWVFRDRFGNYLPPTFWASKFVIDGVYAVLGKKSLVKYVDEEAKNPQEMKEKRIQLLEEQLFGDESNILGRTITGEAVGYTGAPTIDQSKKES